MWDFSVLVGALCILAACVAGMRFLPMKAVRLQFGALLVADTTTLAPTLANVLTPIIAPFVLSENLTAAGLTLATTNGLSGIAAATGSQEVGLDPVTNAQILTIKPGATSGFRWLTSGSFTAPITIYGYALTDTTLATLLAVQQLATPIVLNSSGLQVDADPVQITMVVQPAS